MASRVARWFVIAVLVTGFAPPAVAMNWEGHDDWMLDFQPGFTLELFAPDARPLPSRDCPVKPEDVKKNPYEQIPLPRHHCPEKAEPKH